jgi:signal transduction histidine kinase
VVLSLLISVMIGRGLLVELVGLRNSAMDLAGAKLPAALLRVHAGESIDVDAETPSMPAGEQDEVTQVAEALNAVHRAALRAAVERAEVLSGISGVYVYLARRSQVLLHRQLALLDAMERRTEDPVELEDLFRLDHLTTRMRRLAESLIILSGTAPARRWRRPVPAIDVIRAAVAEIEDFTRVEVLDVSDVAITGQAIADLTHLLAELVENAVVFSPPHTKARVRGELVGAGLVIEIEDRGLGMSREALADANRRIRDADQVDLLETDQLGLFVVNRLAHRQHIKVTLQRSPYGGVTAVVLIPEHLIDASRVRRDELEPSVTEPVRTLTRDRSLTAVVATSEFPIAAVTEPAVPAEGVFDPDAAPSRPEPADPTSAAAPRPEPGVQLAAVPTSSNGEDPNGADDELPELPRRVRRAHLAPELRDGTVRAPTPPHAGPAGDERRTPERARDTLTAARTGWLRGQSDGANESEQGGQE